MTYDGRPTAVASSRRWPADLPSVGSGLGVRQGVVLDGAHLSVPDSRVSRGAALRARDRILLLKFTGYIVAVVAVFLALSMIHGWSNLQDTTPAPGALVQIGQDTYRTVAVLTTPAQHEAGVNGYPISGSQILGFKWATASTESFWMKGVPYPLTLIVVNHGRVAWVARMAPCLTGVCPLYTAPMKFAVAYEIPAAAGHPRVGDSVGFPMRVDALGRRPGLQGFMGGGDSK